MLDLHPFDRVLNTLQCDVHCGHPMRRQPVISEFKVAILKKCPMNPGLLYVMVFMHDRMKIKSCILIHAIPACVYCCALLAISSHEEKC